MEGPSRQRCAGVPPLTTRPLSPSEEMWNATAAGGGTRSALPELECIDLSGRGCRSAGVSRFGSASRRPLMASVGPAVGGIVVEVGEHVVTARVQGAARVGQFL